MISGYKNRLPPSKPLIWLRKVVTQKKQKLVPGCQQPQTALPPASAFHCDDSQILPDSGDSVPPTSCPFLPPRSESEPDHVNLAADAHDVDFPDQEADDPFVNPRSQSRKGHKTTEFWEVKIIDFDGTIKPARISVREAMERPNGRKVMLRFKSAKQDIRDEAGLLSGVLSLLGSDYEKFPICKIEYRVKNRILGLEIFCIEANFLLN
ncbi:hypothetical protein Ahy_B05g077889 [Arachis hypogaea]|uniref:Uncharacterized protein n=1 Tax=Arachis hypogaea TaxID=3818 RepID=A0A444Z5T8_ARAHY|nr:hypothetical protein Ahy_B05g077889 [Arachis hypogaea]